MQNEQVIAPYYVTDLTGKRVLVLAPHPDDETIGCGGSIIRHCLAEDPVKIVFLTDGARGDSKGRYEKSAYIQLRQSEALKAGRSLGVSDTEFWKYGDRHLADADGALGRLVQLLEQFEPELVYLPSPVEFHPDHRSTAFLFKTALNQFSGDCDVAFYEISQPMIVNTLVDITTVLDRKQQAIKYYESQLSEINYEDICMALNRFRSLTLPETITHAEGFCVHHTSHIRACNIFSMFYPDEKKLQGSRQNQHGSGTQRFSKVLSLLKSLFSFRKKR